MSKLMRVSHSGKPHELEAQRASVGHTQIADEGYEAAMPLRRTARANGGRGRIDGGHAQLPAGRRTRNGGRALVVAGDARLTVEARLPPEQPVIEVCASVHFGGGW